MKKIISAILFILIVATSVTGFYFYKKVANLKENPNAAAEKEAEELVSRVGKLIILPEGEIPTIATVSDPEKLKGQPFFAKAKVGDKVLLYSNAKKAYLYDPVNNKILDVAPLNIGGGRSQESTITTEE